MMTQKEAYTIEWEALHFLPEPKRRAMATHAASLIPTGRKPCHSQKIRDRANDSKLIELLEFIKSQIHIGLNRRPPRKRIICTVMRELGVPVESIRFLFDDSPAKLWIDQRKPFYNENKNLCDEILAKCKDAKLELPCCNK